LLDSWLSDSLRYTVDGAGTGTGTAAGARDRCTRTSLPEQKDSWTVAAAIPQRV